MPPPCPAGRDSRGSPPSPYTPGLGEQAYPALLPGWGLTPEPTGIPVTAGFPLNSTGERIKFYLFYNASASLPPPSPLHVQAGASRWGLSAGSGPQGLSTSANCQGLSQCQSCPVAGFRPHRSSLAVPSNWGWEESLIHSRGLTLGRRSRSTNGSCHSLRKEASP